MIIFEFKNVEKAERIDVGVLIKLPEALSKLVKALIKEMGLILIL